MRTKLLTVCLGVSLGAACGAQSNPFISIEGTMVVSEGGTATARGLLEIVNGLYRGGFDARFSRGAIESLTLSQVRSIEIPTVTAFFEGLGVASIRRFGVSVVERGHIFCYVDDLSGMNPPQPDQLFMRFTSRRGEVFVRHGRIVRGDILVSF